MMFLVANSNDRHPLRTLIDFVEDAMSAGTKLPRRDRILSKLLAVLCLNQGLIPKLNPNLPRKHFPLEGSVFIQVSFGFLCQFNFVFRH